MKRKKHNTPKSHRPGWTKEQADAYSKYIRTCQPINGTFIHTVKTRKQALKYAEVKDETIRSDVQSERAEG